MYCSYEGKLTVDLTLFLFFFFSEYTSSNVSGSYSRLDRNKANF